MSKLLNYTSRRSPLQNALIAFAVVIVGMVLVGAIPTQWWAGKYNYDIRLGEGLIRAKGYVLYLPWNWVLWGWKYGDVPALKSNVQTMLLIAAFSEIGMMIAGGLLSYRLARYTKGMEGLHGTAHFAEYQDVDKTGFVDTGKFKAQGVVVGSVMLDWRGKIIHPHHPKYAQRYQPVMLRQGWKSGFRSIHKRDKHGRLMYQPKKSVVKKVKIMRDGGNTHLFAFCPTRSGKGVGMVIPTLLTWRHSVMVNDPKGEAYALTSGFRKSCGQSIIKFEPACTDGTGARWNPLAEIRTFTLHDVADAQMIMAMACDPKGKGLDDYFDKAGYEFLTALALHIRYTAKDGNEGSLAGCASYLGDPNWDTDKQMYSEMMSAEHDPEGKMEWVDSFGKPTKTHPMIANSAKTMMNKEDKDRSGVLSTAKSLLSLYLDPIVANNTNRADFLVRDLMTGEKPVSLYFVVKPNDMERMTPLTRLFYAIFIRRNAAEMAFGGGSSVANYTHQMLMVIDEATSLQKLPILQEALGYVAGYGIRMFFLVQDIVQIEELYGDKQSFDSGAESRVAYAPNKVETAEKLARMTGKTTVVEESANKSQNMFGIKGGNVSVNNTKTARDLMTADEIMALHDQDLILFVKGQPPIYGRKAFYYENPVLLGRAAMDSPARSDVLRVSAATPAAEELIVGNEATQTPRDKWAAGREAMRDRIAEAMTTPRQSSSSDTPHDEKKGTSAQAAGEEKPPPASTTRSRYATQVRVISDEERKQVEDLVATVGVVEKVMAVSAF
ncbi:type IV secretory system conjugative DNA transfer family protein [Comamonas testosteroni]|jgi:type IV secretion system protein VirD4|uniref:type IV secretory system conjugative DNA transfer family protein n=1 Tax=Comamonas testosteroni TaxID=285 RepID=UPI0026EE1BC3|nr:type IV secretory system conjugative DNA transfer family protein [Comamonas testosteroni]